MDRIAMMTTFTAVVSAGSFSAAAKRLNMSPASASTHVQALEDRLSVRLLNRSTRKLSLTDAGRVYYDQCCAILAQLEAADTSVSALNASPRGTLRINAASTLSFGIAPLIAAFTAAYPEVSVELVTSDHMVDMIEEGVDVAIRLQRDELPPTLIIRRLGLLQVILCAAPGYLEKVGAPRQAADLSLHNCMAYMYRGFDKLTREWRLVGPEGEIDVQVSGNLHTNSIQTLLTAALDGRGIVMATCVNVEAALQSGRLVRVLPDHHAGELPLVALYPHRQHVSAKLRSFLDFAAEHFAETLSSDVALPEEVPDNVEPLRRIASARTRTLK